VIDAATSANEKPIFFPGGGVDELFGIYAGPTGDPLDVAVVFVSGGGPGGSLVRNRLWVRLCRTLPAFGYHTFRFDWHGVGDSTGTVDRFLLSRPFTEDLLGAIHWLHRQGLSRFIVVGSCFGGRTALSAAPSVSGLEGIFVTSLPFKDYPSGRVTSPRLDRPRQRDSRLARPLRRIGRIKTVKDMRRNMVARRDRSRLSDETLRSIAHLVHRDIPILFIYGTEDRYYGDLRSHPDTLAELQRAPSVEFSTLPGQIHAFTTISSQDEVAQLIVERLEEMSPRLRRSHIERSTEG
jgi:pimeloyl-ACP methyl ester carboxylesterase